MLKRPLLFLLALCLGTSALAQEQAADKIVDIPAFLATQDEIAESVKSGRFGFLKPSESRELKKAQATLRKILSGVSSVEQLKEEQRVAVFNAQEKVNAIISRDRSDEVRCETQQRTGSHFRETRCYTAEQLAEQRRAAERLRQSAMSVTCGNQSLSCGR